MNIYDVFIAFYKNNNKIICAVMCMIVSTWMLRDSKQQAVLTEGKLR